MDATLEAERRRVSLWSNCLLLVAFGSVARLAMWDACLVIRRGGTMDCEQKALRDTSGCAAQISL